MTSGVLLFYKIDLDQKIQSGDAISLRHCLSSPKNSGRALMTTVLR